MTDQSRRRFLLRSAALGCSAAASPWVTPLALASAPWDNRLVVILLRGGMDGIDAIRPVGDPDYARLRGAVAPEVGDPTGFYALHPALSPLRSMWDDGELAAAHAVSTPYRDKRSHFDGQDLLEAGVGFVPGAERQGDGWLNRLLQAVPGVQAETAFAVGRTSMLLLSGDAPFSTWSPESRLAITPQAKLLLQRLYGADPLFGQAATAAISLSDALEYAAPTADLVEDDADAATLTGMMEHRRGAAGGHLRIASFVAGRLRNETRIAAFSLNGWDTHNAQHRGLDRALDRLSETLIALKLGLGPVWGRTAVLAMTEFGRTVALNGTAGTDHGTGGAMVLAGGAVRGGRVHGDWPGLAEADRYDRRDLMPTADVRTYAAQAMQELFGLSRAVLSETVFPGLDFEKVGPLLR
ncbi:MAG: DUF1501 domain-containing protein [Pseudomonadota bacterium]